MPRWMVAFGLTPDDTPIVADFAMESAAQDCSLDFGLLRVREPIQIPSVCLRCSPA
jgi:hypothetical protein